MSRKRSKEAEKRRSKRRGIQVQPVVENKTRSASTPLPENGEIENGRFKYPIEIIRFLGQIFPSHFEFDSGLDPDNLQDNQIVGGVRNSDNLLVHINGDIIEVSPNWKPK
ncbi:MAG: hypothetical protein H6772_00370 [Pseudomonadales bacterium]|nr:hypothetical protein [Pseudomonadales bacterium]